MNNNGKLAEPGSNVFRVWYGQKLRKKRIKRRESQTPPEPPENQQENG